MNPIREIPSPQINVDTLTFQGFTEVQPFLVRQYIVAQAVKDPQLGQQVQNAWGNFVESGQIWALVIGFFLGYWFRYMSSG